jgi:hypothetical protein
MKGLRAILTSSVTIASDDAGAECVSCPFVSEGGPTEVLSLAKKHVRETGHAVRVETGSFLVRRYASEASLEAAMQA